jgi:non-specific serine/threonine protein kinase
LLVVGGRDSGLLIGPTEAFDGSSWQDRAPVPTLRDHLAAAADGRALYAVGGRFLSPSLTSDALERYDPVRDAWERLAALPTARGGLGLTAAGGRLVAAGGEDASDTYPQVEAFDVAAGTWSTLPAMPTPRHGLGLAAVGGSVFALVGGRQAGVAPSTVAEALSPA